MILLDIKYLKYICKREQINYQYKFPEIPCFNKKKGTIICIYKKMQACRHKTYCQGT